MDNLFAGIWPPPCGKAQSTGKLSRAGVLQCVPSGSPPGWQVCRGISGSIRVEWVAGFVWNQWQAWSGIRTAAARAEFRSANQRFIVEYLLQRVECDSAHFNIGLLDDDGHYVGSVSVHLALEVFSRCVLGFALSIGKGPAESSGSVVHMLRYAISPKKDPAYPMHGLPQQIATDSGPGYRSDMTKKFIHKIGGEHQVAPVRSGWFKPFVESFIRVMREKLFSDLDGYLGKYDPNAYSDTTLKKSATLTVNEFRKIFYDFIVNVYHHTELNSLGGLTPYQKWNEGLETVHPITPEDLGDLRKLRGERVDGRALTHVKGITYNYQRFNCDALQALYHDLKRRPKYAGKKRIKVDILVDPLDASGISVILPDTGELLDVPNIDGAEFTSVSYAELSPKNKYLGLESEMPCDIDTKREIVSKTKRRNGPEVPQDDACGLTPRELLDAQDSAQQKFKDANHADNAAARTPESSQEEDDIVIV